MVSVSSLYIQSVRSLLCESIPLVRQTKGIITCRNKSSLCFNKNESDKNSLFYVEEVQSKTTKRREALFQIVFAAFSVPSIISVASAESGGQEDFRIYSDDTNKFKILIPQDWQVGTGQTDGIRSVTGFYPQETSNSNVSVVITGLGADFTRLESFGKVDAFAESLVSGLDRSWRRPPGVAAKLIDSKAANGLYYIEYSLQNPGESCRHIFSVIGMASNGWYNRLYTVTGQFMEEESEKYGPKIEKTVSSFRFT